jgi:hypothetical protein
MAVSTEKFAIVTCVHRYYHPYLKRWIQHFRRIGCDCDIHIIVLDKKKLSIKDTGVYVTYAPQKTLRWGVGDYIRLGYIRELLLKNITCAQCDIDVMFKKNPLELCSVPHAGIFSCEGAMGLPRSVSSVQGFVLCSGFYILKPASIPFVDSWTQNKGQERQLDQADINNMLYEGSESWFEKKINFLQETVKIHKKWDVCALPQSIISRHASGGCFAEHSRDVLLNFDSSIFAGARYVFHHKMRKKIAILERKIKKTSLGRILYGNV